MKDINEYSQASTREAVELMQRYVFHELHQHRLSLNVPEYNKALTELMTDLGFNIEVRKREALYRFSKRWDSLTFGQFSRDWKEEL